jgi:serine/threonine protein kinase
MSGFRAFMGKNMTALSGCMKVNLQDGDDGKTIIRQPDQTDGFTGKRACPKCGLEVPLSVTKCPQDGTNIADTLGEGRKIVGNYEFLEFVGSGGMGVIYKARHPVLKRLVAVKMLHSHLMTDVIVKRFQQEALAVSGLSHANVIAVHDFGLSEHGQPYMVMDFVDGKPLSEILRQGTLGIEPVLNIAIQLAEGLQHAHEHGVLHRDLKPSNIMVTDADCDFPEAKIVDFGIAKIMESESTRVTQTGELLGTPQYMSPEQCRGGELDARSDVYSLGCVIFEAITGKPPFSGESMVSVIVDQISKPARSLGEVRPDIQFPIELEDLLAKALAKEPVDRFQSMNALLQEMIDVQRVVAQREKSKKSIWRYLKLNRDQRHVLMLSIASAFALIGVASSSLLYVKTVQAELEKKKGAALQASAAPVPARTPDYLFKRIAKDRVDMIKFIPADKFDYSFAERFFSRNIYIDYLDCRGSQVNDAALVFIGKQIDLKWLSLQHTKVTDKGLDYLKDLVWLNELHLDETEITAGGIKKLSPMRNLSVLSVGATNIGDKGLENLHYLPVQSLSLAMSKVPLTDNSFRLLSAHKPLLVLNLWNVKDLPEASIARLGSLPNFQELLLEDTDIKDSAIPYICKIKTLKVIELAGTQVSLSGIKQLSKMPNLELIKFRGAPITAEWIPVLAKFPKLIKLNIPESNIDDATLALIPRMMPKLENLDLENCKKVTDKGLASVSKIKRLFWTRVKGTAVTPKGVADFNAHKPNKETTIQY